jgi:hypothetical protein
MTVVGVLSMVLKRLPSDLVLSVTSSGTMEQTDVPDQGHDKCECHFGDYKIAILS